MKKIKVGIIYGGQSFEHEVSKMTDESIRENIDRKRFNPIDIYIDKSGSFNEELLKGIDVAFLAVHGPNCEDGTLQKRLEDAGVKYTGSEVAGSRLNMDKIRQHQRFREIGLRTTTYISVNNISDKRETADAVQKKLGYPAVVKPNNGGSSVGISMVNNESELLKALAAAQQYDERIIIEQAIVNPREIEVGVLGNTELIISEPGEILSDGKFYSYDAKYFHPFSAAMQPENIDEVLAAEIKSIAEQAYRATDCRGYARVDFFINNQNECIINEINTLPGFTRSSMYPKLMAAKGISYPELITRIIELALE